MSAVFRESGEERGDPRALTGNQLLDRLDPQTRGMLWPALQTMSFRRGAELPLTSHDRALLRFPVRGVLAEMVTGPDGDSVEMAVVGRDGFAPFETLWSRPSQYRPLVALSDIEAYTIELGAITADRQTQLEIWPLLIGYAFAAVEEAFLGLLCNARHSAMQRLSRFLLRVDDRTGGAPIQIGHDLLSQMLGVRRATITTALHSLAAMRAISMVRREIVVSDRSILEAATCACYSRARTETAVPLLRSSRAATGADESGTVARRDSSVGRARV